MRKILPALSTLLLVLSFSGQVKAQDSFLNGFDSVLERLVQSYQDVEDAKREYEAPIYVGCSDGAFVFYVEGVGNICRYQQVYNTAIGYTDGNLFAVSALEDGDVSMVRATHSYRGTPINQTTLTYWQGQLVDIEGSDQYWQGVDLQIRAVKAAIAADSAN